MDCNSTLDNLPNFSWNIAIGGFMCVVTVTASIENFLVLVLFCKYAVLRTPSNKILASLSMADFLTGSTVAPLHAIQYLNKDTIHNCTVETLRRYLSTALIGASTLSLGFISYDRCLHLIRLQKYQMKNSLLYPVLSICWVIPFLIPLLRKVKDTEQVYSATILTFGTLVLLTIVISYSAVIASLRNYAMKSKDNIRQKSLENEKRAGITVLIIITLYILMMVPVFIHHGLNSSKRFGKTFLAKSYSITMMLAIANSFVNPLIYCYRTDVLKKYLHQFFTDTFRRSRKPNDSVRTYEIRESSENPESS